MEVIYNNRVVLYVETLCSSNDLENIIDFHLGLPQNQYYLLYNGKPVANDCTLPIGQVHVVPRLVGGKGGFGSMLRAIGAQIEKTTNREACRDLSGRRLRDINEEQRLKNWVAKQAEREQEAAERKRKKLEKLREKPKHEFKDEEYHQLRQVLPEQVEDAVTQGLQASGAAKRKTDPAKPGPSKKSKLWFDEPELSGSDDSSDSDDDQKNQQVKNAADIQDEEAETEHAAGSSKELEVA